MRRLAVEHGGNGYPEFLHHRPANVERHDWRNHRGTFILEKGTAGGRETLTRRMHGWRTRGGEKERGREMEIEGEKESTRLVFPAG